MFENIQTGPCMHCNKQVIFDPEEDDKKAHPLRTHYWVARKDRSIVGLLCDSKCSLDWYEANNRRPVWE